MKNLLLINLIFSLLLVSSGAKATLEMLEYPGCEVDDPRPRGTKIGGHLSLTEIMEEELTNRTTGIEGINLRANHLTTEGVRYLVGVITNPKYAGVFENLKYINLTANPVEVDVLEAFKPILERTQFKFLDIRRTPASESQELSQKLETDFSEVARKIICIPPMYLSHFKTSDPEAYKIHKAYYDLSLWE